MILLCVAIHYLLYTILKSFKNASKKLYEKGFLKGKWEYLKIDQIMLIFFFKVGLEVRGNKIISMPNIEEVNIGGMYMLCKE